MSNTKRLPKNKQKVFLTGVTGFVGHYLLYLLCEAEWVDEIYVLIRPKRNKSPEDRLKDVLINPLYEKARELGTKFENITCIPGDLLEPKLGMSEETLDLLSSKITLVIHNAAALSFAAGLQDALTNNTTPSWILYEMCKNRFKKKPSFIMVSTIATNSHLPLVPERVTEFSGPAQMIYEHVKNMDPKQCDKDIVELKEGRLDGYAFSKGLLERMIVEDIEKNGSEIPVYFVRPGGIISTVGGPLTGWLHETCFYGQLGYYVYTGKIFMFLCNKDVDINMAPVDLVSNLILCCCLDAVKQRENSKTNSYEVRVVNGSKPMIEGVTFGCIFKNVRARFDEYEQAALEICPGLEKNGCPREPFYLESAWFFNIIFNIFVFFPLWIYTLVMGSGTKKVQKLNKLTNFVYKFVKVLQPYVTNNILVENGYCDVLQEKYGDLYPIETDVDRDEFVQDFIFGIARYQVPPMEKRNKKLL